MTSHYAYNVTIHLPFSPAFGSDGVVCISFRHPIGLHSISDPTIWPYRFYNVSDLDLFSLNGKPPSDYSVMTLRLGKDFVLRVHLCLALPLYTCPIVSPI